MNVQPSGWLRRRPGRMRRFAARHPVGALLLFVVPVGVAGLTLLLAARFMPGAVIIKVGQIVLLMLSPTLLFAAICHAPHGVRAVRRLVNDRRLVNNRSADRNPQPSNPPIEQIAADLRRLLWQHEVFARATDLPMRAQRMRAMEAAITDCATQAARALEVPYPDRPAHAGFDRPQLRRLLRALAAEGLVLPPAAGLLAPTAVSDHGFP